MSKCRLTGKLVGKVITVVVPEGFLSLSQQEKKPYLCFKDQLGVSYMSLQIYFDPTSGLL